jgi:integral membrane protein (TIGR01906 family)
MKKLHIGLSWLITLILPFILVMSAARLLFGPLYLNYEYNKPAFPSDSYGFTKEDRLYWGEISIDYLFGQAELEGQTLPDGSPLYNERELSHMVDVQVLVQQALLLWYGLLVLLAGLAIWAWRGNWSKTFWNGISRGGWLTAGLLLTILVLVATSFDALFTQFHHLFFTGDTWLFQYSDTLIRLFPMKFWQDAFALMGGITLLAALALGYLGGRWTRITTSALQNT